MSREQADDRAGSAQTGQELLATAVRVLLFPIIVTADVVRGPARYRVETFRGWMPAWQHEALQDADHPLHGVARATPDRRAEMLRAVPGPEHARAAAAALASLRDEAPPEAAGARAAARIAQDLALFGGA